MSVVNVSDDLFETFTDPCEEDNGGCEGTCIQKKNGRDCMCDEGYVLVNETICQSKNTFNTLISACQKILK